jgi:urease accessory protein
VTSGAAPAPSLLRVGRDGALSLRFERRGPRTVLAGCRSVLPLQVLAPVALDDRVALVSMLNPTGGIVGGDRLLVEATAGPGAHACLTTPSATRVYRSTGAVAEQSVALRLGAGALVEWVPDHTIPFGGAAFRQQISAHVEDGAGLVLVDAFAAGRVARGETWRFRLLESALAVRDRHGWLFHDRFRLTGDPAWNGLGRAEGHPYLATVVVVAEAALAGFEEAVNALVGAPGVRGAVARLPRRGAVVRVLAASAPALAALLDRTWTAARETLFGLPRLDLRKP